MSETLRLKRHETFSIREGWLEKGINIISEDPECFLKEKGPLTFGLGTNMCKALRYWLEACGIATFSQGISSLTEFGRVLRQSDRFLEENISWWFIHCNLAMNKEDAPVINSFFNNSIVKMDKEYIFRNLKEEYTRNYNVEINDSSLDSDVSILLKSYYSDDESNPEDNMNCPLAKIKLLSLNDKKIYHKVAPVYKELSYKVIYWCILKCLNISEDNNLSFNVEDLCIAHNNPLRIFNLNRTTLFLYLEDMKKYGLIELIKTAGLNTVHVKRVMNIEELYRL